MKCNYYSSGNYFASFPLNFTDILRNNGQVTELFRHITESFTDSQIHGTCHGTIMVNLTDFSRIDGKHGTFLW